MAGLRILSSISLLALLASVSVSVWAGPGQQCKEKADQAKNSCQEAGQATNAADVGSSQATGSALGGQDIINPGAQGLSGNCSPQQQRAKDLGKFCEAAKATCEAQCKAAKPQVEQICQDPNRKSECQQEKQALQQGEKTCQSINGEIGQANAAAGGAGACDKQSKETDKQSNMQPPQIPQGGKEGEKPTDQQKPTEVAAPKDETTPATNALASLTDGGNAARFAPPASSKTSSSSSSSMSPTSSSGFSPSATVAGMTPSAAGGGGGSGSASGSMKTSSTAGGRDPAAAVGKALAEGLQSGSAPSGQFGEGGGMSTSSYDSSLSDYLPGGKKDPKAAAKKDEKKMGAASTGHPDIAGQGANLFGMVTRRMTALCDSRQFIGCNGGK